MAVWNTKDFGANKVVKIRKSIGRRLGHPGVDATNNEINDVLTAYLVNALQEQDTLDYEAAAPAPDQG